MPLAVGDARVRREATQRGRSLDAIVSAGGAGRACFALDPEGAYPPARGWRIAKTYEQLGGSARIGQTLFDELEHEDWRLPKAVADTVWGSSTRTCGTSSGTSGYMCLCEID